MADLRRIAPKNGLERAIWVSKVGFFLVGILSVGMSARVAVSPAAGVLASTLPRVWASLGSWLAPPYLFVVIHLIILVIWKLSDQRQQHHQDAWPADERPPMKADAVKIESFEQPPPEPSPDPWPEISPSRTPAKEIKTFQPPPPLHLPPEPSLKAWRKIMESPSLVPRSDAFTKEEEEKPAAWSAFEMNKTSIEQPLEFSEALTEMEFAAAARVENDSMEATWKAIMEKSPRNGEKPAIRHEPRPPPSPAESTVENDSMEATWKAIMEKSPRSREKWAIGQEPEPPPVPSVGTVENDNSMEETWKAIMEKSPRNREKPQPPSPAAIKGRLLSVTGRDELNQRCDEFIKKRYDQIRLQRHESNQRRLQMVNAGSH